MGGFGKGRGREGERKRLEGRRGGTCYDKGTSTSDIPSFKFKPAGFLSRYLSAEVRMMCNNDTLLNVISNC